MNLYRFLKNVKSLTSQQIINQTRDDLTKKEKSIIDLQERQFDKGEDRNKTILGRYSRMTEILSGGRKKYGEPYNLKDTGAFRHNIYLKIILKRNNLAYEIGSRDSKTSEIEEKIGKRLWGLQNKGYVKKIAKESFIKTLNKKLIKK